MGAEQCNTTPLPEGAESEMHSASLVSRDMAEKWVEESDIPDIEKYLANQHINDSLKPKGKEEKGSFDAQEVWKLQEIIRGECKNKLTNIREEVSGENTGKHEQGKITKQVGTNTKRKEASEQAQDDNDPERNNIDRMVAVYEYFDKPETNKFIDVIIQKYIGKKVNIDGEILVLTKENMEFYRENFENYILSTIYTESSGNPYITHDKSSATALGQWLIGNGGTSVEVSDLNTDKKLEWVTKSTLTPKKNDERLARIEGIFKKPEHRERTINTRNSYETALNRVLAKFNEIKDNLPISVKKDLGDILPSDIVQARSGETPMGKSLESQIAFLVLDTISHTKIVKNANGENVSIDTFMKTILARGNYWEMEKAYAIYHHRRIDKKTKGVFRRNYNKVTGRDNGIIASI